MPTHTCTSGTHRPPLMADTHIHTYSEMYHIPYPCYGLSLLLDMTSLGHGHAAQIVLSYYKFPTFCLSTHHHYCCYCLTYCIRNSTGYANGISTMAQTSTISYSLYSISACVSSCTSITNFIIIFTIAIPILLSDVLYNWQPAYQHPKYYPIPRCTLHHILLLSISTPLISLSIIHSMSIIMRILSCFIILSLFYPFYLFYILFIQLYAFIVLVQAMSVIVLFCVFYYFY